MGYPVFSELHRVAVSIVGALLLSMACMSMAASMGPFAPATHSRIA